MDSSTIEKLPHLIFSKDLLGVFYSAPSAKKHSNAWRDIASGFAALFTSLSRDKTEQSLW